MLSTAPPEPTRATSPSFFNLSRPSSRSRSNTNPRSGSSTYATNDASNHRQLTAAFHALESKYRISWECAELLIELSGGPPASQTQTSPPNSATPTVSPLHSAPIPIPTPSQNGGPPGRERAVTLAGDEPKPHVTSSSTNSSVASPPMASPPHPAQWRASTGRHDLSSRQLLLLREILNNPHDVSMPYHGHSHLGIEHDIPEEEVNRGWRWGDAMTSTITLYSEESSQRDSATGSVGGLSQPGQNSPIKKRRSTRLGMRGLRDMLKSLKKSVTEHSPHHSTHSHSPHHNHYHHHPNFEISPPAVTPEPVLLPGQSSTSVSASTDSSLNLPRPQSVQTRLPKTSTGPESTKSLRERHPNSPYGTVPALTHKSPRRPSLASIFRLGHKTKSSSIANSSPHGSGRELGASFDQIPYLNSGSSGQPSAITAEEDDWHQISSASELELASKACGLHVSEGPSTVRGKKGRLPYSLQNLQGEKMRGIPETPKRTPNASQTSITGSGESPQLHTLLPQSPQTPASYSRSTKLSNVRELAEFDDGRDHFVHEPQPRRVSSSKGKQRASGAPSPNSNRPPSRGSRRGGQTGSVRSAPPQAWISQGHDYSPELQAAGLPPPPPPSLALAMTPENLKPLLENALEVHTRCNDCIAELRSLLQARRMVD